MLRFPVTTPASQTAAESRAERQRLLVLLAAALLACAGYAAAEWYLLGGDAGFPLDDSWIHLQFARNLAAGGAGDVLRLATLSVRRDDEPASDLRRHRGPLVVAKQLEAEVETGCGAAEVHDLGQ